ncbi:MAG: hypothetical protein GU356_01265 [Pyrobaculum sp.]|jgi:hypothetical protein|nr:hypothetical protein [Pyrobaculum sp.]
MQSPNQKKLRGISGVVIAVLLAVIGIAAVLMFWGMMSGFFSPQPKVIIEKATITKVGQKYDLSITVRETGGASTCILGATIMGGGSADTSATTIPATSTATSPFQTSSQQTQQCGSSGKQGIPLGPGQSMTISYVVENQQLSPGVTYYVAVYYLSSNTVERTDLYPITVR